MQTYGSPCFAENASGWGLDWLWPRLCTKGRPERIAILDATPVRHTRPLGGNLCVRRAGDRSRS